MVDTRVLIAAKTGEYARRADFYDWLKMLEKPAGSYEIVSHDPSPAKGRNDMIKAALNYNCTHILFIDDDMAMPPDGLMKLLSHDLDVVTGLYVERAYPHKPLIFDDIADDGQALYSYLEGGEPRLKKVMNCGLGFVLIKTTVFDRLEQPFIRLGEYDPERWSDDIGFFNRITAAGFDIWCDMECLVGHIGNMIIWPKRMPDGSWQVTYDTNGQNGVSFPYNLEPSYQFKGE